MTANRILAASAALLITFTAAFAQCENYRVKKDKATKLFGYIDKNTKDWVIPPSFHKAKNFEGDRAIVTIEKQDGLIDDTGNFILPAEFNRIVIDHSNHVVQGQRFVLVGGRSLCASNVVRLWGLYGMDGREIISPAYDSRFSFNRRGVSSACLASNRMYGLVSIDGRVLAPFRYISINDGYNSFVALDRNFLINTFDAEGNLCTSQPGPRMGYVRPYDPGDDDVKAVVYKRMLIGERIHKNAAYGISQMAPSYGGSGRITFGRVADAQRGEYIDWGDYDDNFIRLSLVECASDTEGAMYYKPTDTYYTVQAALCAPDGTLLSVISDHGWYDAVCDEGVVYNAAGRQSWFLSFDMNFPARSRFVEATHLVSAKAATISAAFGLESGDERLLRSWDELAALRRSIVLNENSGLSSYEPIPIPGAAERYIRLLEDRYPVLRHLFGMGEVFTGRFNPPSGSETAAVFDAEPVIVVPFIDHYDEVGFTNRTEEEIFWGFDNMRYVKLDLLPFPIKRSSVQDPLKVSYLWDDSAMSSFGYSIAVNLYESDGTFVRTLGVSNDITVCEPRILVLGDLGMAFADFRPDWKGRLKFEVHNPPTNQISSLGRSRL